MLENTRLHVQSTERAISLQKCCGTSDKVRKLEHATPVSIPPCLLKGQSKSNPYGRYPMRRSEISFSPAKGASRPGPRSRQNELEAADVQQVQAFAQTQLARSRAQALLARHAIPQALTGMEDLNARPSRLRQRQLPFANTSRHARDELHK